MRRRWALSLAVALLAGAPALAADSARVVVGGPPLPSKEVALWSKLADRLGRLDAGLDGVLGFMVKDLKTGATLALRADEVFPQASSIKLAILYELYREAEEGRIALDEVVRLSGPRVAGSGVLHLLGERVSVTWRDMAVLMMAVSDNAATNALIDRLGMEAVNSRLDGLGLHATRLRRRMMDLEAARRGDENVSTPAQMLRLMEGLRTGSGLSPGHARDMMAVAAVPKTSAFRAALPETLTVADKDGELEGVRCVTAAVEVPGRPYVAAVMTTFLRRDPDGDALVREVSAALFETFDRLARSSEHGRIISEH